ncbi:MAG: Do family serine endopeptidase [Pseudomonadota bacterium]
MKTFDPIQAIAALALTILVSVPVSAQDRSVPTSPGELQLSFAPIVKQAAPAVVNVYASRVVRRQVSPFMNDPFFRRFFGGPNQGLPRDRVENALGSGVIVSPDGLVVTNHHVIEGADEVRVVLADRRELAAEIVISDERTDLAVLRIETTDSTLPHLSFAEPDILEVGDLVLAIGNPFGVGQTVTAGIVSATARTQAGITDFGFFIQTDAAINPGNSGGALVDMDGRLVGINTAIFSRGGGSVGIGFAIPADMVQSVVAGVASGAGLQRPWFGATLQEVTSEIAETFGLDRPVGVLVVKVRSRGPAEAAGVERGDLVLAVDGDPVNDLATFGYRYALRGVGGQATLTVLRDGREILVPVELMVAPEDPPRDLRTLEGPSPLAGAVVGNLSPALSEEIGLELDGEGVVIVEVAGRSPARSLGVVPGDIIVSINDIDVRTTADVEDLTVESRRLWRLTFNRRGRILSTVVGG